MCYLMACGVYTDIESVRAIFNEDDPLILKNSCLLYVFYLHEASLHEADELFENMYTFSLPLKITKQIPRELLELVKHIFSVVK